MKPAFFQLMELKKQRKPGSGRKPIDKGLRKVPVTVFLENRVIDAVGGQAKVKAAFVDFISSIYQSMHHAKTNHSNHRPDPNRILP